MKHRVARMLVLIGALMATPEPSASGQEPVAAILQQTADRALRYTDNLPNFICTQTVLRSSFDKKKQTWKPNDTLMLDLTYTSGQGETYRLISINGKPTKKNYKDVGGFTSSGEFGTLLHWVFRPESQTKFEWKWAANLRGHDVDVLAFHIDKEHSQYHVGFNGNRYDGIFAWGGLVYIDRTTHDVLRLTHGPDTFPEDWPATGLPADLDYDFVDIGGERFLLPLRAEMRVMLRDGSQSRNEILFRDYHRFTSQSTIRAVK